MLAAKVLERTSRTPSYFSNNDNPLLPSMAPASSRALIWKDRNLDEKARLALLFICGTTTASTLPYSRDGRT